MLDNNGISIHASLRTKPGLNPYHASVADIGYGFDSVQGTIDRIRMGESFPRNK